MTVHEFYVGDCRDVMPTLERKFDLVITSPPYNTGKNYDSFVDKMSWFDYGEFIFQTACAIKSVLKPNGRVFWVVPLMAGARERKGSPYIESYSAFDAAGYEFYGSVTWVNHKDGEPFSPLGLGQTNWGSWMSPSCPVIRCVSNHIMMFHTEHGWKREVNKELVDIQKKEFMHWTKDVWLIRSGYDKAHPATFPVELPLRCMKLFGQKYDWVLDPFSGVGSTALAGYIALRNTVCIDISEKYVNESIDRFEHTPVPHDEAADLRMI